jgi:pimeloyl-ACP methyl ester carboxylesterase
MPAFAHGPAEIYYEEYGSGYPLLTFAPGALRSQIAFWHHSPSGSDRPAAWMDPTRVLASGFRVIAMDQRNAGRSRAPVHPDDDWGTYAADHIALLDHLEIERTHIMGGCIGSSFCLRLCRDVPERIGAAVLQNPMGLDAVNAPIIADSFRVWRESMRERAPDVPDDVFARIDRNLHDRDFTFSVAREDVTWMKMPLLVMPGDDGPHPTAIGEEIARLAPHAEVLMNWKAPQYLDDAIRVVTAFLVRNTPVPIPA